MSRTRLLSLAGAATICLGVAGVAVAAQSEQRQPVLRADSNGDGAVSRSEFLAQAETRFARLDVNRDGRLTPEERPSRQGRMGRFGGPPAMMMQEGRGPGMMGGFRGRMMGRMADRMIDQIDTNKDGKISRAEFDASSAQRFARIDANNDGTADAAEQMAGRRGRMMQRVGQANPQPLTKAQFIARAGERFQRWDTNKDGAIDSSERGTILRDRTRSTSLTTPPMGGM